MAKKTRQTTPLSFSADLERKLNRFGPETPCVWELHLSAAEFAELAQVLKKAPKTAYTLPENARAAMVYIAEWYHRRYTGDPSGYTDVVKGVEARQLWEASGMPVERLVFGERWQYSIFVLGGLAVRFELAQKEERFLRLLCRSLVRSEVEITDADMDRAKAFTGSIRSRGSIYRYLMQILKPSYTTDDPDLAALLERVRRIYGSLLGSKFTLEWRLRFSGREKVHRSLIVQMHKQTEGYKPYVSVERAREWGFSRPAETGAIRVQVQFLRQGEVVHTASRGLLFEYSGSEEAGFLASGEELTVRDVPVEEFDAVRIVAFGHPGDGEEGTCEAHEVQLYPVDNYTQYWLQGQIWTTARRNQRVTAVLADPWVRMEAPRGSGTLVRDILLTLPEDLRHEPREGVRVRERRMRWAVVTDSVSVDGHCIYNLQGEDTVHMRLYPETIVYENGSLIRWEGDEGESALLPLVFGREDILVTHYNEGVPEYDYNTGDVAVEFRGANGLYRPWSGDDRPPFGPVRLRVRVKGVEQGLAALYLPGPPPRRDLDKNRIIYTSLRAQACADTEADSDRVLTPWLREYRVHGAILRLIRPIRRKEICIDGRLYEHNRDERVLIPYLRRDRIRVNCFGASGYSSYECRDLGPFLSTLKTGTADAHLQAWWENTVISARMLDPLAPEWLDVSLAGRNPADLSGEWLVWSAMEGEEPERGEARDIDDYTQISFQDTTTAGDLLSVPAVFGRAEYAWPAPDYSLLTAYRLAVRTGTYFFTFNKLRDLTTRAKDSSLAEELEREILRPLRHMNHGALTEADRKQLARMADELGFDWAADLKINL